jgi:hypothetical protein
MGRWKLAFRILFDGQLAARIGELLDAAAAPRQEAIPLPAEKKPPPPPPPTASSRNDALTLLATLQREARFVDFLMEPLDGYSDAQVGAAVRDVHRDSRNVLDRLFALRAVIDKAEGTTVALGGDVATGRIRLTGNAADQQPANGTLMHHGWEATRCELPKWTGAQAAAQVLAPAEVEVRSTT